MRRQQPSAFVEGYLAKAAKASFEEDTRSGNATVRSSIKHSYTTEGKNYVD